MFSSELEKYSWEDIIEEDQVFRDSLRKGLEGI